MLTTQSFESYSQASVARKLGVSQDAIYQLEQQSDLLLSTLRRTVEAMGGSLSLVARFPDRPSIELADIAEHDVSAKICRGAAEGVTPELPNVI